jgi:hypothetical protein
MATTLWMKHDYAKCHGHWVVSDPDCAKCAYKSAEACEKRTKARVEEVDNSKEVDESGEVEEIVPVSPLDYLLQSLEGKFEKTTEEKERAILHKFCQNGKFVIAVVIGIMGKIKVVSILKNKARVFEKLDSIEEVESVLMEMS